MANNFVEVEKTTKRLGGNNASLPNVNVPITKPNNNAHNLPEANAEHPQRYLKNNSLPEGWRKVQMKKNPKVMWYENEETQNRSWVPPGQNNSNLPLNYTSNSWYPKGWRKVTHKNNNANTKAEWYEHNSGETSWELPEATNNNANVNSVATNVSNNASDPGATSPSAANLKKGLNDLSQILNTMENTLKQQGGRRHKGKKSRKTRKTKARKARKTRKTKQKARKTRGRK